MISWIVAWPCRKKGRKTEHAGVAEIVQVMGDLLLVRILERVVDENDRMEPDYHRIVSMRDEGLHYFPTMQHYFSWLNFWEEPAGAEPEDDEGDGGEELPVPAAKELH